MSKWEEAVLWLRDQPEQSQLVKDCYYDQPPIGAARRFHGSEEWKATKCWFPARTGRALDLGAGHGIASFALSSDGWNTTALEPDRSDIVGAEAVRGIATAGEVPVRVVVQRGESLPFREDTFDLVYARQVLHHAADLPRLCKEVHRVLKPGGTFVAVREHVISSRGQLAQFQARHPLHSRYGGESAYTVAEYKAALREAGLRLERVYRSFDTIVNYAPFTKESLREKLNRELARVPGGFVLQQVFGWERGFMVSIWLLSQMDNRPGRLYSFVAMRPGAAA